MENNAYHIEHQTALQIIRQIADLRGFLAECGLHPGLDEYLDFRRQVSAFLQTHFSGVCAARCFQDRLSACCGREGIVAFFADMAINAALSSQPEINALLKRLAQPNHGSKCVYLDENGCLWKLKPLVCELFLCNKAEQAVFSPQPELKTQWLAFRQRSRYFNWPDHPALFDQVEACFMDQGMSSALMYCHLSPGLLMVKKRAGGPAPARHIKRSEPHER